MSLRRRHVLLEDRSSEPVSRSRLAGVADVLQQQVADLARHWAVRATVTTDPANAGERPWIVRVVDQSQAGLGVHLEQDRVPYAEVTAGPGWTVTASHELLEMLIDPHGRKVVPGFSLDPADPHRPVLFLVEVCDPCETVEYTISGVQVSDFVTPEFYHRCESGPYSFMQSVAQPLQVLPGGYISWLDLIDFHWHQVTPDGSLVRSGRPADLSHAWRADKDAAFAEMGMAS